jgi:hypothetical protein
MNRRLLLIIVCTMVLVALGVSTFGRHPALKTETAPTQEHQTTIPEHITYGMFLRDLNTFNQKAEAARLNGNLKSREAYRNFYKARAGWSDAEFGGKSPLRSALANAPATYEFPTGMIEQIIQDKGSSS